MSRKEGKLLVISPFIPFLALARRLLHRSRPNVPSTSPTPRPRSTSIRKRVPKLLLLLGWSFRRLAKALPEVLLVLRRRFRRFAKALPEILFLFRRTRRRLTECLPEIAFLGLGTWTPT